MDGHYSVISTFTTCDNYVHNFVNLEIPFFLNCMYVHRVVSLKTYFMYNIFNIEIVLFYFILINYYIS